MGEYDSDAWCSPVEVIETVRLVLGTIELDPASNPVAQRTVRAETYYTAEDDGLAQRWSGKTWLNPPYSHPLVAQFATRLTLEHQLGNVPEAILLVNNVTEVYWFQQCFDVATAVCFPSYRFSFWHMERENRGNNRAQALFYFGPGYTRFQRYFGTLFGRVILLVDR